jgi:hypothetical protein
MNFVVVTIAHMQSIARMLSIVRKYNIFHQLLISIHKYGKQKLRFRQVVCDVVMMMSPDIITVMMS